MVKLIGCEQSACRLKNMGKHVAARVYDIAVEPAIGINIKMHAFSRGAIALIPFEYGIKLVDIGTGDPCLQGKTCTVEAHIQTSAGGNPDIRINIGKIK